MEDKEFNKEFDKIVKHESFRDAYYTESIEQERAAILSAFQDHFVALTLPDDIETIEDILAVRPIANAGVDEDDIDDTLFQYDELAQKIEEFIQKDIERHPILLEGEIKVHGKGIYQCFIRPEDISADDEDNGVRELEDGEALMGHIKDYTVDPFTLYNARLIDVEAIDEYADTPPSEGLSLLLSLSDAQLIDDSGVAQYIGEVCVPFDHMGFRFEKVVRQSTAPIAETESEIEELKAHFNSDFITQAVVDMENDLTYNTYDDIEEHIQAYNEELSLYMGMVDSNRPMKIRATALRENGEVIEVNDQPVYYSHTALTKFPQFWRVTHIFIALTSEGSERLYIQPRAMVSIEYTDED